MGVPIATMAARIACQWVRNQSTTQSLRSIVGSLAMFAAMRLASSFVSSSTKIERPTENDSADERPNKCAEQSIFRPVAVKDAEPSASYSRD